MLEIEIIQRKGIDVIDSKLLHKKLEVASYHADWIRRRIENYCFVDGEDYFQLNSKMSKKKSVGRPTITYLISLDMAKELAMLENNDIGKATRKYFIKVEREFRKTEAIRLSSIHVRKSLTDTVKESGENERMHGHGYATYTKMVYEVTGLTAEFKEWKKDKKIYPELHKGTFREELCEEYLKRVELAESLIKPLLELDKQYHEIKDTLKPLFDVKRIK